MNHFGKDEKMRFLFSKGTWKRIGVWAGGIFCLALLLTIGFICGFMTLREEVRTANRDVGKIVAPRGIDEAKFLKLGGVRQWVTIRGQDHDKPVMLFLHGGPGSAKADYSYSSQRPWEDEFVVVNWDQRGAGRSAIDKEALRGTITLDQYVADTTELLTYLKKRFGRKVVLFGQSWGTLLGSEVAKRRPDLINAFVSLGQVTAWEENFAEGRRLLIDHARNVGDKALEAKMLAMGPQPKSRDDFKGERAWSIQPSTEIFNRGHSWHNSRGAWYKRVVASTLVSPTMSNWDLFEMFAGRRQLTEENIEQIVKDISGWKIEQNVGSNYKVPVIMMMGAHDWQTPITLARRYYKTICAPYKVWVEYPYSAHVIVAEEPGTFQRALIEKVLPATEGRVPEGAEHCAKDSARQTLSPNPVK